MTCSEEKVCKMLLCLFECAGKPLVLVAMLNRNELHDVMPYDEIFLKLGFQRLQYHGVTYVSESSLIHIVQSSIAAIGEEYS